MQESIGIIVCARPSVLTLAHAEGKVGVKVLPDGGRQRVHVAVGKTRGTRTMASR